MSQRGVPIYRNRLIFCVSVHLGTYLPTYLGMEALHLLGVFEIEEEVRKYLSR